MIQLLICLAIPQEQCDMTDKKHPHHGHKPNDCDEPEVTPLDVNEPLPDDGDESGGGGTTNPKDPGGK